MRYDHYLDNVSFRQTPISDRSLELLGKQLVNWALSDESALKIRPFFTQRGMGTNDVKRWRKRNKKFDAAYDLAFNVIGDRRECGALIRKLDSSMVIRTMALYDKDWKLLEIWRSEMKKKEQEEKATSFTIKMQSFSDAEERDGHASKDGSGGKSN